MENMNHVEGDVIDATFSEFTNNNDSIESTKTKFNLDKFRILQIISIFIIPIFLIIFMAISDFIINDSNIFRLYIILNVLLNISLTYLVLYTFRSKNNLQTE